MVPHLNVIPPLAWTTLSAALAGLVISLVERWRMKPATQQRPEHLWEDEDAVQPRVAA
jgi:hypothetical protein